MTFKHKERGQCGHLLAVRVKCVCSKPGNAFFFKTATNGLSAAIMPIRTYMRNPLPFKTPPKAVVVHLMGKSCLTYSHPPG